MARKGRSAMQFFENGVTQVVGRQLKWIAGLILLILVTRGMRDRDMPEVAAQLQPTGVPLMWLHRAVSVVVVFGALIFLALAYQSVAYEILRSISSFPMEVK